MKEGIVRQLQTEYEAQRAANRAEEQRRLEEASRADPAIARLWEKRRTLLQDQVRAAFAHPGDAQAVGRALTEALQQLNGEIRVRLTGCGLPDDYLQPVYRCPICQDTGYTGEPIRDMCTCMQQKVLSRLCQGEGLGLNDAETFERYRADVFPDDAPLPGHTVSQRAYMERIRDVCLRYADAFPHPDKPNLVFFGASGLGKTFLMNCIGARVLAHGYTPVKTTAYRLLDLMREVQFGRGDAFRMQTLLGAPLLLIDDLGTEPMLENVTILQWFNLFNERDTRGLSTIISTNFSLDELRARYTERVCSRLLDVRKSTLVRFMGRDVRIAGRLG